MEKVNIIGVYTVENYEDVFLIELLIHDRYSDINIGEITQEIYGMSQSNWQAAYDEKYLNEEGTKIVGDYYEEPEVESETTRLAFFFHFIDFNLPLTTQYGKLKIPSPQKMPQRLKQIITYDEVD